MRNDSAVYGSIEGPVDGERARELVASSCLWNPAKGILTLDWYMPDLKVEGGRVLDDGRDVTGFIVGDRMITTGQGVTPAAVTDFIARYDLTGEECDTTWMNAIDADPNSRQMTVDEISAELVRSPGSWVRCWHRSLAPEEEGLTASIEEALRRVGMAKAQVEDLMAAAEWKALTDKSDLDLPEEVDLHDLVDAWRMSWVRSIEDAVSFGEIDEETGYAARKQIERLLVRQFGTGVVNGTQPRNLVWTMPTPDGGRMSVLDRSDESGTEPYTMLEINHSPRGDYEGDQVVCSETTESSVNSYAWRPGAEEYGYSCVDGVEEAQTSRQAARGR